MTFNIKDLNFNVELSSVNARVSNFPRENCLGISLLRPDNNIRKYRVKLLLHKDTCRQAEIKPYGFILVKISDCSNAAQILYQEKQGERFKGYAIRPTGGYKNKKELIKYLKENNDEYMNCFTELTVPFDELNTKKTNKFANEFVDIIHLAKHQIVIDISKVRLFVKGSKNG